MDELHITIVSRNRQHLDQAVHALGTSAIVTPVEGTADQPGLFPGRKAPDLLIVDGACEGRAELDAIERLGHLYPEMAFIILCERQSPDFLIEAMRAGVREVLPSPPDAQALRAAADRIRSKRSAGAARKGKVLAFVSCKGGSGATLLAANLAYALSALDNKVALFDLNLQFGDALLFLSDQKPPATLADVARDIARLDPALLASSMVPVGKNLGVLAAPEDPAHGMEVKPEHVDTLLKLARNQYDFVVIDAGRTLDAHTIKALDEADTIFAVLQTTMPFVRDGKRLMDVFRSLGYPEGKVQLVVNRHQKGGDIGLADLERALGSKVLRVVPNHYEATAASVNQGIPIAKLARNSPVTKALQEWSESLSRKPEPEGSGWMARLFRRTPQAGTV